MLRDLVVRFGAMPGSEGCLVVADLLEERGDWNSEIVRESLLVDTDFEENSDSGVRVGRGDGFGDGYGYGWGSGWGNGAGWDS